MWLGILGTSQATSRRFKENPNSTLFLEFERWMAAFDKHYPNDEEKERRFAIFKNKLEWVKNFNKQGNHSFTVGINQFSDMTPDEFRLCATGRRRSRRRRHPRLSSSVVDSSRWLIWVLPLFGIIAVLMCGTAMEQGWFAWKSET
ncbi:putative fruit bromelain [Rosa chinensis]|uniref:Putative fruit bromelain n=1 Tax=Rosa chinensis TaxID=74649 RepID=A0A2P6S7H3_ROSCH|nr:putative fruit bromelain [Rosa chinensis]